MNRKTNRVLLMVIVVLSLMISACQAQATTTEVSAPEDETEVEEVSETEGAEETGEISETEEDQIKITFLGESSSTDIIWSYRVERMAEVAEKLNVDFTFRFAEGDYARHAQMIEEETARGVDAIIGPWWDESQYNEEISNAVQEGVFVYGILGIAPRNTLPSEIVEQLGWADFDWYEWGREAGRASLDNEIIPDGGNIVWPAEVPSGTYITDAVEGFEDIYEENGKSVNIEVIEATADSTTAVSRISSYLISNPDIDALVTSGAIAINAANVAYKDLDKEPGEIPLIGQVVSPACAKGIEGGYMPLGVNLELTDSSYYALIDAWAVVELNVAPPKRTTGFTIITTENLETDVPSALQE